MTLIHQALVPAPHGTGPETLGAFPGRRARGERKPGTLSAETGRHQAHGGRFLPTTGRGLLAPAPLGGITRVTRSSAARAARGDQGDGVEATTVAPSQSVEKVVPEATGEGDGLTSASGPGDQLGSNSPERAYDAASMRGGV